VTYSANGNDYEFRPHAQSTGCSGNTITSVTAAFGLTTTGHVQVEMQLALNAGNITGGPGVTIGVQSYWGDLDADVAQWWPYRWTDDPSPFAKMRFPVCDGCYIDQRCYHDGAPNPNHVCQTCSKAQSTTDWSTAADDTACTDDGLFCDGAETCQAGVCTSAGDPCSADETCDETADACVTNADDDTTLDDDTTADDDVIADDDASPHANANGSSGGGCGC
jgi:hypothetical protein